jgi:hypothetical protein
MKARFAGRTIGRPAMEEAMMLGKD